MLHITRRIALYACLCCSVASQAINFHIPSYISARCIAERARSLRGSLTASLSKAAHCKTLAYIQTHPKKVGVYALVTTAALSVCICGLRAMNRHSSEGARVSLAQRIRNLVGRLGSFMHREQRQQTQESALEQQLRQELEQLQGARRALEEKNTTLAREKDELERRRIELEQQVEQQQKAYSLLSEEVRKISSMPTSEQLSSQLAEAQKILKDYGRRLERCDAESANLRDKLAAYERKAGMFEAHCTQLKLKLDRLQHRITTADATTQTEYSEGPHRVVVSRDDGAPSEMPLPPSGIDFRDRQSVAESLSVIAGEGRAEVTGVLEQTRRVLELAQQRNKVDVTKTSSFGSAVGDALGTSYHPTSK
ncbi:MAG TPA: hypothetical protein PKD74_00150 [Candidatus Dependentiae bacterium]|nr:hypothetical protein [Candidatus Dependentiae bacterium]